VDPQRFTWGYGEAMPISTDSDNSTANPSAEGSLFEVPLSKVDEDAIYSLASELDAPLHLVARIYRREFARLARGARVKTFLPLVVSRLVRRRSAEDGWNTA
jgi:hypothetical protein